MYSKDDKKGISCTKTGSSSLNGVAGFLPAIFMAFVATASVAWGQASAPVAAASSAQLPASASAGFIAGLQPDRRPEQAPRKQARTVDDKLIARWMSGVSQPWPGNVEQIARNGDWWVPLRHPGMTGPYDIRGWHARPSVSR